MVRTPTQGTRRPRAGARTLTTLVALLLVTASAPALATHFRYGHITWRPRPDVSPTTVEFTVQNVWRRDAFTTANNRCVNTSFAAVPCTGGDNRPGVGDIVHERQGGTQFDFGDGSTTFGRTIAGTKALLYLVTSIDPVNNWVFGLALDHDSFPAIDTTIQHTYPTASPYVAKVEDCCRISPCASPNAHMNNPDNGYRVTAAVDLAGDNSSPVSSVPPIVLCPQEGQCTFAVPVSDNEGDEVEFRMATAAEMHVGIWEGAGGGPGLGQPGPPACTHAAGIDAGTGAYGWDTAMCRLAGSPTPQPPSGGCNNPALRTLYSTQVHIEETQAGAASNVDFLIELIPICPAFNPSSPAFVTPPTPLCGTAQSINPGNTLSFTVQVADGDAGDSITLNAVGLPAGASMSPGLPTSGDPVSSTFSWTPTSAQLGQHVITFTATDQCSEQALCAITIDVSLEDCTDAIDNDGDGLIDCADPDCNGTPCDDGNFCTVNDTCQMGVCGAGPPRDCGDANACTADSCDEENDQCVHTPLTGTACDDGLFCTDGDVCDDGACTAGPPRDCGDANTCTVDSCDDATEQCVHVGEPDDTPCDDGLFCTDGDTCQDATCTAGPARDCGDGSACTVDSCDEDAGTCVNDPTPLEGTSCDDGLFCTVGDVCTGGACGGAARSCDDGQPCTADVCDEDAGQCVSSSGPAATCHRSGRSVLVVRDLAGTKRDRLVWRWVRGNTPAADLGDPVSGSTSYTLCLYDETSGSPTLAASTTVAAGGSCGGKPCWLRSAPGGTLRRLRYRDRDKEGIAKLVLRPSSAGQAKVTFVARGDRMPALAPAAGSQLLAQDPRVRVQLVGSGGACWESEFTAPAVKNRADLFRDRCGAGAHPPCD